MLKEIGKFRDGSVDYGNGVIGPSTADINHFNSLREPVEKVSTGRDLRVKPNALTSLSEYFAMVGSRLGRPEAVLATVLITGACGAQIGPVRIPGGAETSPAVGIPAEPGTNAVATASPVATKTPEPNATATPKPTETPKATATPTATKTPDAATSTVNQTGVFRLQHPDQDGKTIEVRVPSGFTPDSRLNVSTDTRALPVGDLNQYKDWETALNTGRPAGDRLAGYNYDYNDFCPVRDFKCNVQLDMYAWRVFQGQEVDVPGIGHLVGSERRSVLVIIFNLADDVKAYDEREAGQVTVVRGFTATGRIFDGNKIATTERNVTGHWLYTQKEGRPEKSYTGITDSPDNARETLLVTVIRKEWGKNADGTKRYQDQLLRAEIVTLK